MKPNEVFKKIGSILTELNDQYEYLQTTTDELNDLELELFVSNAHFLSDHIGILRKLNLQSKKALPAHVEKPPVVGQAPVVEKPAAIEKPQLIPIPEPAPKPPAAPKTEEKFFEPVVQQMRPAPGEKPKEEFFKPAEDDRPAPSIDLSSDTPEDSYSYMREEPETIRHELILDESMNWDDEDDYPLAEDEPKETENTYKAPEVIPPVEPAAPKPAEAKPAEVKYAQTQPEPAKAKGPDEVLTINQRIQSQLAEKAAANADHQVIKPISDIKEAITLNDKLLFVKDLFNGYNLAYSEAIEILNRFNTFEEATRFLNTNYVVKNNWEGKPATTEKFYALLRRRYA